MFFVIVFLFNYMHIPFRFWLFFSFFLVAMFFVIVFLFNYMHIPFRFWLFFSFFLVAMFFVIVFSFNYMHIPFRFWLFFSFFLVAMFFVIVFLFNYMHMFLWPPCVCQGENKEVTYLYLLTIYLVGKLSANSESHSRIHRSRRQHLDISVLSERSRSTDWQPTHNERTRATGMSIIILPASTTPRHTKFSLNEDMYSPGSRLRHK